MHANDLRIALFSGNYNYVRDGANQALNLLVGHLLSKGATVRVYSPTVAEPAFPPAGDLVSVPSIAIPRRREYRLGEDIYLLLSATAPYSALVGTQFRSREEALSWARSHLGKTAFRVRRLSWGSKGAEVSDEVVP